MTYIISTICFGNKYEPIKNHWLNRINNKCLKKSGYYF